MPHRQPGERVSENKKIDMSIKDKCEIGLGPHESGDVPLLRTLPPRVHYQIQSLDA
jgi:hypothetical protein